MSRSFIDLLSSIFALSGLRTEENGLVSGTTMSPKSVSFSCITVVSQLTVMKNVILVISQLLILHDPLLSVFVLLPESHGI